jgi:hypothetical protein
MYRAKETAFKNETEKVSYKCLKVCRSFLFSCVHGEPVSVETHQKELSIQYRYISKSYGDFARLFIIWHGACSYTYYMRNIGLYIKGLNAGMILVANLGKPSVNVGEESREQSVSCSQYEGSTSSRLSKYVGEPSVSLAEPSYAVPATPSNAAAAK